MLFINIIDIMFDSVCCTIEDHHMKRKGDDEVEVGGRVSRAHFLEKI